MAEATEAMLGTHSTVAPPSGNLVDLGSCLRREQILSLDDDDNDDAYNPSRRQIQLQRTTNNNNNTHIMAAKTPRMPSSSSSTAQHDFQRSRPMGLSTNENGKLMAAPKTPGINQDNYSPMNYCQSI